MSHMSGKGARDKEVVWGKFTIGVVCYTFSLGNGEPQKDFARKK